MPSQNAGSQKKTTNKTSSTPKTNAAKKVNVKELETTIATLQKDNETLRAKNAKLKKDCTNFAKRLKKIEESGILNVDVDAIQAENNELRYQMSQMQRQLNNLSAVVQTQQPQETTRNKFSPKNFLKKQPVEEPEYFEEEEEPDLGEYNNQYAEEFYDDPNALPIEEDFGDYEEAYEEEPRHRFSLKRAKRQDFEDEDEPEEETPFVLAEATGAQLVARHAIVVLLAIVIISLCISAVSGLYATKFQNASIFGHRFYTVVNDAMEPEITTSDIVWVKTNDLEDVEVNDVVLSTASSRSFATVTEIGVSGNTTTLYVQDATKSYTVTADEYLGTASKKIADVGKIAAYACNHPYNFFAYHLAAALILVALLLLIPSKKKKYSENLTAEDFII